MYLRHTKGRKKEGNMREEHHSKENVRLTIDFPVEQHTYIKMMAAKEGISMRKFIINHLPGPGQRKAKKGTIKKTKFETLLDEIMTEYDDELRSLSKK
jgi:hypothetical protein